MTFVFFRKNLKELDGFSSSFLSSDEIPFCSDLVPLRPLKRYFYIDFPIFTWALETLVSFLKPSLTPTYTYGKNNRKNNRCNQNHIRTRNWFGCSWHRSWNHIRPRCHFWSQRRFKSIGNRRFDWRRKRFRWAYRPPNNPRIITQTCINNNP